MSCGEHNFREKLTEICREFNNDPNELISILHKAQGEFGFLPQKVQETIANIIKIPSSRIYGVVTFYSYFTMEPKGKYPISICTGTACYVKGAEKVLEAFEEKLNIKNGQTTSDGKFSMSSLRCVGACGLAPVVMVGDKIYGSVNADQVEKILSEYD
ncbi:MAG: NADH-quinone oxidoreductase subunit NuoE [Candidatus Delongbacteria bacterium]|jgi:NADP-reducing hydrogenase subunit HndA|nr:NADH-quinone oxidoreductase subunit NuoE [Candidatus Delongbacteria bacterium]